MFSFYPCRACDPKPHLSTSTKTHSECGSVPVFIDVSMVLINLSVESSRSPSCFASLWQCKVAVTGWLRWIYSCSASPTAAQNPQTIL